MDPQSQQWTQQWQSADGAERVEYTLFGDAGRMREQGVFWRGRRHGVWRFWDSAGVLREESTYSHGRRDA